MSGLDLSRGMRGPDLKVPRGVIVRAYAREELASHPTPGWADPGPDARSTFGGVVIINPRGCRT